MFNEPTRQLIAGGLSALFPPLGIAYQGARLVNAAVKFGQDHFGSQPQASYTGPNDLFGVGAPSGSSSAPVAQPQAPVAAPPDQNVSPSMQSSHSYGRVSNVTPTNTSYNAARSAFSPTFQQLAMPGSAIGPLTGGTSAPGYIRPGAFLMGGNQAAAWANANTGNVRARNIL